MAEITAYPVIFSGPMIRALLEDRKFQTRRLACKLDGKPSVWQKRHDKFHAGERSWLYVRETFMPAIDAGGSDFRYAADYDEDGVAGMRGLQSWKPSIHMPKLVSRLSLRVTGMRIEPLCSISKEGAIAEGVECHEQTVDPTVIYTNLWDRLNAKRGYPWSSNPEVVVIQFHPTLS